MSGIETEDYNSKEMAAIQEGSKSEVMSIVAVCGLVCEIKAFYKSSLRVISVTRWHIVAK